MSNKTATEKMKKPVRLEDQEEPHQVRDTPDEMALDVANELSFPASDPVSVSNITRIEKAPETASAADDHQNAQAVKKSESKGHGGAKHKS
ncbi:MAG TPA: hypothetical protein VGM52_06025 [Herbaspirillum sp.]|jgi:hypothetical protein